MLRTLYQRSILTWRLFWDGRVSFWPKLIPLAALAYLLLPIDIAPEVLMGLLAPLGLLDDIGIILLALNLFVELSPPDVVREHLKELGAKLPPRLQEKGDEEDVVDSTAEVIDE
jgi:uncharacterized membrane protein YkvA (DUF1232 family)